LNKKRGVKGAVGQRKTYEKTSPIFSPEDEKGQGLLYRGYGRLPLIWLDAGEWEGI